PAPSAPASARGGGGARSSLVSARDAELQLEIDALPIDGRAHVLRLRVAELGARRESALHGVDGFVRPGRAAQAERVAVERELLDLELCVRRHAERHGFQEIDGARRRRRETPILLALLLEGRDL